MVQRIKETEWGKLSDPAKTILERIDINRKSAKIFIGETIKIPYFKGIFTEEIAEEILKYQDSDENEGNFSAYREDNLITIQFLKSAF